MENKLIFKDYNEALKQNKLLGLKCQACGHINLPRYNRTNNPLGGGCVNCHVAVHGSNHPSGAKQVR